MTKVQSAWTVLLLVALVAAAGCDRPEAPTGAFDRARFGAPYQVVTNRTPAAPDEPPAVLSDSLTLLVSYVGGCADHSFELDSRVRADTANVWLFHEANGDTCEADVQDRLTLPLPEDVLLARSIHLVNPHEELPFVLRWDVGAAPAAE